MWERTRWVLFAIVAAIERYVVLRYAPLFVDSKWVSEYLAASIIMPHVSNEIANFLVSAINERHIVQPNFGLNCASNVNESITG